MEYNEIFTNKSYAYSPIYGTDGILLKTQFLRQNALTYIKLKNINLWLYEDDKTNILFYDIIRDGSFYHRQPLVLWINYITDTTFIIYKYIGYGLDKLMEHTYDKVNNVRYLIYTEKNDKTIMKWSTNVNAATQFKFDKIPWGDFAWKKLTRSTK